MGISFGSINTGLPKDIVQQIIAAEKIPLEKMEVQKQKVTEKKELVNELIRLMEDLKKHLRENAKDTDFRELKVDTNNDLIDVTLDNSVAMPGSTRFEVVKLAQKSSAMSSGFSDKDESYVGVGYIQYYLPNGESREIYVDQENSSLAGIAKLINQDESNGLRASVINDGSDDYAPWRLLVSLTDTGDGNVADFPYFYFVDGEDDLFLEFEREAHDAVVKIDGMEVQVPGNKVKDLIPGATIDLKKARPGEEFSINISDDIGAVSTKLVDFVEKINNVLSFINKQNQLDENSDTSRTLGGDILIQSLESRLRNVIFRDIQTNSGPKRLAHLGVTFQRNGLLRLEENKLNHVLSNNYHLVSEILLGIYEEGEKIPGFFHNLHELIDNSLLFPNGLLQTRKKTFENQAKRIDRRIADRQRIIDQREKNLKERFSRLEGTMAKIKSQGAGVNALAANANAFNPVQQLG